MFTCHTVTMSQSSTIGLVLGEGTVAEVWLELGETKLMRVSPD